MMANDPDLSQALAMTQAQANAANNGNPAANDPDLNQALALTQASMGNANAQSAPQGGPQYPTAGPINQAINQAVPALQNMNIPLVSNTAADMLRGYQATGVPLPMSLMQGIGQGVQGALSGAVSLYNKLPSSLQGIPGLPSTQGNLPNVPNPQALQNPISPATAFVGNMASSMMLPGDLGAVTKAASLLPKSPGIVNALAPVADRALTGAGYGALYGSANGNTPTAGSILASAAIPAAAPYAIAGAQNVLNGNAIKAVARPVTNFIMGNLQNRGLSRGSPLLNPQAVPAQQEAIGNTPASIGEFINSPKLTGEYNKMTQQPFSGQDQVMQNKLQDVKEMGNNLMDELTPNIPLSKINPTILDGLRDAQTNVQNKVDSKQQITSDLADQTGLETSSTPSAIQQANTALSQATLARQKNVENWLNGSPEDMAMVKRVAAGRNSTTTLKQNVLPEGLAQYQDQPNIKFQQTGTKTLSTSALPEDLEQYQGLQNVSIQPTGSKILNNNASWQDLPQYQGMKGVSITQNESTPNFGIGPQTPKYTVSLPTHTVTQPTYSVIKSIPNTLLDALKTRQAVGERLQEARLNGQDSKGDFYSSMYKAMSDDLEGNINATGNPDLMAAWKDANDTYRDELVPFKTPYIRNLLRQQDAKDLSGLADPQYDAVLKQLPDNIKDMVAHNLLSKSLELKNGEVETNSAKLANNFQRIYTQNQGAINRLLPQDKVQKLVNFKTLYDTTKNAVPYVYPPATGFQMKKFAEQAKPYLYGGIAGLSGFIHPALALSALAVPPALLGLNRGAAKLMTNPLLRQAYGAITTDASGNVIPNALARRQFINQALPYKPITKANALARYTPMIANALAQGNQSQ